MKKCIVALLALVMLISLAACGGKAPVSASPVGDKAAEPVAATLSISETVSEDGSFKDEWGGECTYSYHVPQLDADTPDAAYINDEINTVYGDIVAASRESIAQKIMPDYFSIQWESYQNGSVASIVIKTITYYSYSESYDVYNYDTEKGVQLFTSDILAAKGVSEAAYYNELRRTAIQYFDDTYFDTFTEWGDLYCSNYSERRGFTSAHSNIVSDTMAFLDDNGEISAIVKVGSLAEADRYQYIFPLDLSEKAPPTMESDYFGLFSAALENGELTVFLLEEATRRPIQTAASPIPYTGFFPTMFRCFAAFWEISAIPMCSCSPTRAEWSL